MQSRDDRNGRRPRLSRAAVLLLLALLALPSAAGAAPGSASRSAGAWNDVAGRPAATHNGHDPEIRPERFRALTLDRDALGAVLRDAPAARGAASRLTISVPFPGGGFHRFAIERSAVMAPGLAAKHPEIATYSGTGMDDPGATIRLDLTPVGFHASVRGPGGSWYVDPYYHRDQSTYVSYHGRDLVENPHGALVERGAPPQSRPSAPLFKPFPAPRRAAVTLRTYRLALLSDPGYASYHGAANVTAAKVTLMNRVSQIYEDDLAISLQLIANNDVLNLNTNALMQEANGPCGAAACYTPSQVSSGCQGDLLLRTRLVIGLLVGARNFDIGHIGMGVNGGGLASLGVVGDNGKAQGCTGVTQPVGDLFAVDYVAHEMGHQFSGEHTYNGDDPDPSSSCAGNISTNASVEPGSGSTIMAYAGICAKDDLQPHSDPYFSQRTLTQVNDYVGQAPAFDVDEVQSVALTGFDGTDSFKLTYDGTESAAITRGTNYSAAGIKTAVQAILPSGTVTVRSLDGSSSTPGDTGFQITFGGALAGTETSLLSLTSPSGVTGFAGEVAVGGTPTNGGSTSATGNSLPVVTVPQASYTIPRRTPFALTGSATDADAGDTITYLWEQNDAGDGTALFANSKTNGPLFRVFGDAVDTTAGMLQSPSPGEHAAGTDPTRVFPDLAQIAAGNTNAATGSCPASNVECFSEFLPAAAYSAAMHFRLTARDGSPGAGGVDFADTTVNLAPSATPFRVTSQAASTTVGGGSALPVTWDVAGTSGAPVSTANVKISMSRDGGMTYPDVLAASTPNDGSESVTLPNTATSQARVKVEAVGNVFFDINHADFTITFAAGLPVASNDAAPAGETVQYSDALAGPVTITADDTNTPGTSLTAVAAGLPAGMALVDGTSNAGTPGHRTWTVGGATTAAPGTYPVTVTVSDGTNPTDTAFSIVVSPEDATAAYTGDTAGTAPTAAGTAPIHLATHLTSAADGTAGDLSTATVTFREGAAVLCIAPSVIPVGGDATHADAACDADLGAGTHPITVDVGDRYAGTGAGSVTVDAPAAPVVGDDTPASGASVQYSDALPAITITADDADTAASGFSLTPAPALPAGLTIVDATSNAGTPGTRSWTIAGTTTAAPGVFPVTVTVDDGTGNAGSTSFPITVAPEDATVTYTGATAGAAPTAAATAAVHLTGRLAQAADGSLGDLATATVSFLEGSTTLCSAPSVTPAAGDALHADAGCDASLPAGVHAITIAVGGRYSGNGTGSVQVTAPAATATPSPTASPSPTPGPGAAATLAPDLKAVGAKLKLAKKTGRIVLIVACKTVGTGKAPALCIGTATLTAKVKAGKSGKAKLRTIATTSFSFAPGASHKITLKLGKKLLKLLKKSTSGKLSMTVANTGAAAVSASKSVKLVKR